LRRLLLGWNVRFPFIPVPVCAHTATDSKPGHGLKQPPEASRPSIRPIALAPPDGNPNTSRRSLGVSTCRLPQRLHGRLRHPAVKHAEFPEKVASSHIPGATVLQSPVSVGAAPRPTSGHPFGSFPKISTPVENIVEKRVKRLRYPLERLIFWRFWPGEGLRRPIFPALRASTCDLCP
jgi:hypothetical protein